MWNAAKNLSARRAAGRRGRVLTIATAIITFASTWDRYATCASANRVELCWSRLAPQHCQPSCWALSKVREGARRRLLVILVLPTDHLIADAASFARHVQHAVAAAVKDKLVTCWRNATAPETGSGYIACGAADGHVRQCCALWKTLAGSRPGLSGQRRLSVEFRHVLLYRRRCAGGVPPIAPALFAAGEACWTASGSE